MHSTPSLFSYLQEDTATAVFSLLFSFTRDDACTDTTVNNFDAALFDIVQGVQVPAAALEKLRKIYFATMTCETPFFMLLEEVERLFRSQRDTLFLISKIALRLANDDGYVSLHDRSRLDQLLTVFQFTEDELRRFSDHEQMLLQSSCQSKQHSLDGLYETLECAPDASDSEIRTMYRRLVKEYHPDTSSNCNAHLPAKERRIRFQEIQSAYETIKKTRGYAA